MHKAAGGVRRRPAGITHLAGQQVGGAGQRLTRRDRAVGLNVEHQAVEVGAAVHPAGLHVAEHLAHRREAGTQRQAGPGGWRCSALALQHARLVAVAALDPDLQRQALPGRQPGERMAWVEHPHPGGRQDVAGAQGSTAIGLQQHGGTVLVLQAEDHAAQLQQQVQGGVGQPVRPGHRRRHLDPADLGGCAARQRRQQHPPQRGAEGGALPALEGFQRDAGAVRLQGGHVRGTRHAQARQRQGGQDDHGKLQGVRTGPHDRRGRARRQRLPWPAANAPP